MKMRYRGIPDGLHNIVDTKFALHRGQIRSNTHLILHEISSKQEEEKG